VGEPLGSPSRFFLPFLFIMFAIFVSGGAGFIASHFIHHFQCAFPFTHIINYDALFYSGNVLNVDASVRNSPFYHFYEGNLIDTDHVLEILKFHKVDAVVHFAAQSHVQNSFDDSLVYTRDNVFGTHSLLEACRKYGNISRFIHISTDEVYGESSLADSNKKNEMDVLCPTNPYAATKAAAELIANSYRFSFNMPIIITRGNNVYGPNQYPEKLIPRFIQLLKQNKKVTIQGDGSNVRAFLHVSDVVEAILLILQKGEIGEIYNIGSDDHDEYTVMDISQRLIRMIHNTTDYDNHIEYIQDRPFNDKRYYISNDKVKQLGWEIKKTFDEGLKELVEDTSI